MPPEALMDQMAMVLQFQMEDSATAMELLKLNTSNYPNSANAHGRLAAAYANDGLTSMAIRSYERALELAPSNGDYRERLAELRAPGER